MRSKTKEVRRVHRHRKRATVDAPFPSRVLNSRLRSPFPSRVLNSTVD